MNKKYILGIIGAGNMANAIISGIINANNIVAPNQIIISDIDSDKLNYYSAKGVNVTADNNDIISDCEFIIFAVKPQVFGKLDFLKGITVGTKLISIMAGIQISTIRDVVGKDLPVCRVMPNTPALVRKGMSVLCYAGFDDSSIALIDSIFASIGQIAHLGEDSFDAVTSISGSGPAYVYLFIDAMIKGGIMGGLSPEISRQLAVATVIGAGELVNQYKEQPIEDMINAVCSKGGTTIEAVNTFRAEKLEDLVGKAITACRLRSEELSGKK